MKLKLQYDAEDQIPDGFKDLYTERDGKWHLTGVEGMKTQADVDRVQEALRKEKNDHKETKSKYSALDGLELDDVLAKLDKYPELEAAAAGKIDDAKLNDLVETRIKSRLAPIERERDRLKADTDKLNAEIKEFQEQNRQRSIRDHVQTAVTEAKIRPEAVEDVLLLSERIFEVTEDGQVITKDGVGVTPGVDAKVWLTDMQPKRPHWWPESHGGGSRGGNGGGGFANNPWSADHWNVTEQGRAFRENPARAEQMAKAAGTKIGAGRPAAPQR